MTLIATGVVQWLSFIGPWVAVAIAAGGAYGLLLRGASDVGFGQGSLVLWLAEAGVGIAILAWVFAANGPLRHARVVIGPGVVIRIPHGHQAGPRRSSRSLHARR